MSVDAWITIAILVLIFITLLATKLPPATVFLGALTLYVTFDLTPLGRTWRASLTPAAYQTNLMVYGPGEYSFSDFVKMGVPLTILVGVMTIWLAPIFFPF